MTKTVITGGWTVTAEGEWIEHPQQRIEVADDWLDKTIAAAYAAPEPTHFLVSESVYKIVRDLWGK